MISLKVQNMMIELNNGNKTYYYAAYGANDFEVELDGRRIFRGNFSSFVKWYNCEKNF